ncbi:MAG: hypothetical protein LBH58_01715 [Tannerellaceae bacterium]|jgi:hypothetical protein|nr:hypothetical protein [Tannerellaceae bacterium]
MEDTVPFKWKKYLKLYEFGFRNMADLNSEIHRFDIDEIDAIVDEISSEFSRIEPQTGVFFVIKLINNDAVFMVPNYRIYNQEELVSFRADVLKKRHLYHEVWYCKTKFYERNESLSLAGRIIYTELVNGYDQTIEQIWNRSPRIIDNYTETSDFIFVRASRVTWGFRFNPSVVHLPRGCKLKKTDVLERFSYAVKKIEIEREKIELFECYMKSFGFKSFALEYKINDGILRFIDWDTPNDMLVIDGYGSKNMSK